MKRQFYGCGLEAAQAVVGRKWKPIVLWHLAPAPRRFGVRRRLVTGISETMLIQRQQERERAPGSWPAKGWQRRRSSTSGTLPLASSPITSG